MALRNCIGIPCNADWFFSVAFLTTDTNPLPNQVLYTVPSSASFFSLQYPLFSLRSYSSLLRLLPRHSLSSSLPFVFPSITCFRRRFLPKIWPIHLSFLLVIIGRIFLCSLTLSNTSLFLTWSVQLIFSIILQHHISKLPRYFWSTVRSVPVSAPKQPTFQMHILPVSAPKQPMFRMLHFASFSTKTTYVPNAHFASIINKTTYVPNAAFCQFQHQNNVCSKCSILPVSAPKQPMFQMHILPVSAPKQPMFQKHILPVSAPKQPMFQMQHFASFSTKTTYVPNAHFASFSTKTTHVSKAHFASFST